MREKGKRTVMQNAEPTDTGPRQMANQHYGYHALEVDMYYGDASRHAIFTDDRKAAEWASEALLAALLSRGIRNSDRAEVIFTRR